MAAERNEFNTFESNECVDNTVLHHAIVNNRVKLALSCIEKKKDLETVRLGNTPLLLALKTGNIAIAIELIKHNVNVHCVDGHGLTPLHWACMLRQNEVITLLLDKGANPNHITEKWADTHLDEIGEMTPINLYCKPTPLFCFYHFYEASFISKKAAWEVVKEYHWRYKDSAPRSSSYTFFGEDIKFPVHIPGAMAYTDVIFHMKNLCNNLGWKNENTQFDLVEERLNRGEIVRSCDIFRKDFFVGMFDFCEGRNTIPIDIKLINRMSSGAYSAAEEKGKELDYFATLSFKR